MHYPVRYSTRAYMEYEEILEYVFKRFGADTAFKVDQHFEEVIDNIAIHPLLYPLSEMKNIILKQERIQKLFHQPLFIFR